MVPRTNQVPRIAKTSVRHILRDILDDPQVAEKIEPYINDSGVCGHKMMDWAHVVDIVRDFDKADGNRLHAFHLNDWQIGNKLLGIMRNEIYLMNKQRKAIGLNPRVEALTQQQA